MRHGKISRAAFRQRLAARDAPGEQQHRMRLVIRRKAVGLALQRAQGIRHARLGRGQRKGLAGPDFPDLHAVPVVHGIRAVYRHQPRGFVAVRRDAQRLQLQPARQAVAHRHIGRFALADGHLDFRLVHGIPRRRLLLVQAVGSGRKARHGHRSVLARHQGLPFARRVFQHERHPGQRHGAGVAVAGQLHAQALHALGPVGQNEVLRQRQRQIPLQRRIAVRGGKLQKIYVYAKGQRCGDGLLARNEGQRFGGVGRIGPRHILARGVFGIHAEHRAGQRLVRFHRQGVRVHALAAQAQRQVGFGRRFAGIYIQNVPVGDDFRPRRAQRARQACHENRQPT